MYLTIVFLSSGFLLTLLVVAKWLSGRRKRSFWILDIISKGDKRAREVTHFLAHKYSEGKEKVIFVATKQAPLRVRGVANKIFAVIKERARIYTEKARDSRLIKKSEGISEYFQNISSTEKGNGEINDVLQDISQNSQGEIK